MPPINAHMKATNNDQHTFPTVLPLELQRREKSPSSLPVQYQKHSLSHCCVSEIRTQAQIREQKKEPLTFWPYNPPHRVSSQGVKRSIYQITWEALDHTSHRPTIHPSPYYSQVIRVLQSIHEYFSDRHSDYKIGGTCVAVQLQGCTSDFSVASDKLPPHPGDKHYRWTSYHYVKWGI